MNATKASKTRFDFHVKRLPNVRRLRELLEARGVGVKVACNGGASADDPFNYADACLTCTEAEALEIGNACDAFVYQYSPHRLVRQGKD